MNRKERRAAEKTGGGQPDRLFASALAAHKAGQFARAETLYRRVLAVQPRHADTINLLGVLRLQAGRPDEARTLLADAVASAPGNAAAHYNLAAACHALGLAEDAAQHYRRTTELQPGHQGAWNNLGLVLRQLSRLPEATDAFRAALALGEDARIHSNLGALRRDAGEPGRAVFHFRQALRLAPDDLDARVGLADTLLATGEAGAALDEACRVLSTADRPDARTVFAAAAAVAAFPDSEPARRLLTRALAEGWARPRTLARPASHLAFQRLAAEPEALDPLLATLLHATPIAHRDLEAVLTQRRAALLVAPDEASLPFASALAQQCFINEYVWDVSAKEAEDVASLFDRIAASPGQASPQAMAILASYRPLSELPNAEHLLRQDWPAPVRELVVQQIEEPRAERALAADMPRFTPVTGAVSAAVRAQYEENPYPRWTHAAADETPVTVDAFLARLFPNQPFTLPGRNGTHDVLIAGCGTGQQSVEVARSLRNARVLAVDLSLASLAYAQRRSAGIASLTYGQADLLRLPETGRQFDVIMASGVLHHLADPAEGWRALLALLRPGGVMQVGLYSERARQDVVAARALIAAEGLQPTLDGIRRCRQLMLNAPDNTPLRRLAQSSDFASASGCRDLLFHVQEHRLTLPWIAGFMEAHGLEFLGFDLPAATRRAYRARFPDDPAATNLHNWDAFEQSAPDTFAGMYQFWAHRPAR